MFAHGCDTKCLATGLSKDGVDQFSQPLFFPAFQDHWTKVESRRADSLRRSSDMQRPMIRWDIERREVGIRITVVVCNYAFPRVVSHAVHAAVPFCTMRFWVSYLY